MSKIITRLKQEQIFVTRQALYGLFKKHSETGCVVDLPKRTRTRKINNEMIAVIDEALSNNDELTAREIRSILVERWPNLNVTLSTIKRIRNQISWKWYQATLLPNGPGCKFNFNCNSNYVKPFR